MLKAGTGAAALALGTPGEPAGATKRVAMSLAEAVAEAGRFFSTGRYQTAEALVQQILQNHPKNGDALNILAVTMNATGRPKEAAAILGKAVRLCPDNASFVANLGEIERQRGRKVEARLALKRAIGLDPKHASAHNNLGILHFEAGEYAEACASYRKAIGNNPNFAEAYNNLGNASRFVGEADQALGLYHRALQLRENYPEAYNNLGTLLRDQGKFPESEHAFRKALLQNPRYMEAFNNLANLLYLTERDSDALRVLSDALRVQDDHAATLTTTSRVQLRRGNFRESEEAARRALSADPKNSDALVALGQLYHETDRYPEAIAALQEAMKIAPQSSDVRSFYGVALKSVGRLDEARQELLHAVELAPNNFGAYANLNDLVDFREAPGLVASMTRTFAEAPDPDDPALMPLHFCFGKALEDLGEHPRALEHYARGARVKRAQLNYTEEDTVQFFRDIRETFNAELFKDRPFPGLSDDRMIFIIGMPRSGSTLVEQILSSHPAVFGAGEVKYLARALGKMRDRFPSMAKYPQVLRDMEPFHFQSLGKSYLEQIIPTAGGAARITDKLLTNYFFVGLINLIFPNARFVHTVRNPVDSCLSAYTKLFKDDMPHSYDFGELGRYYREYQALMEHWKKVLPGGAMMEVRYEDVVAGVEASARRLLEFVGLDWDPACVEFHKASRPVKTASVTQVRMPVYSGSVERWRKYGPGIQPLVDALGLEWDTAQGKKRRRPRSTRSSPAKALGVSSA